MQQSAGMQPCLPVQNSSILLFATAAAAVAPVAVDGAPAGPLSLLADVTASLATLRTGNTHEVLPDTATKREAALQRLEDVLGSDFAARLRATTAARQPFQHLSYTPLCAFEPVGVKVSSSRQQNTCYMFCNPCVACVGMQQ
eukprot:jgi/Chrzof1/3476/Cz12g26280.t1